MLSGFNISDKFTVEEINLMCLYNTGSRTALINDLISGLCKVQERDMAEIFDNAVSKLMIITDAEFADIGFYVADEFDGELITDGED